MQAQISRSLGFKSRSRNFHNIITYHSNQDISAIIAYLSIIFWNHDKTSTYIIWNIYGLFIAIITTGANLSPKKWREDIFCSQTFIGVFQAYKEKAIRKLKEKFAENRKRSVRQWAGGTIIRQSFSIRRRWGSKRLKSKCIK